MSAQLQGMYGIPISGELTDRIESLRIPLFHNTESDHGAFWPRELL